MFSKKTLVFSLLGIGLLSACNNTQEEDKKEDLKDTTVVVVDTTSKTEVIDSSYSLPSTLHVAAMFKKSNLSYYSALTNSTDRVNSYKTGSQFVEALNMGVYSADLGYCLLTKQSDASRKYVKACKDLASEMGVGGPFETMAKRLERNMNNQDSVLVILAGIQIEMDKILASGKQEHLSVITFAGAWIETMYIGFQVHAKEGHKNMSVKLVEQMAIAENIIKALKVHQSKAEGMKELTAKMNSLMDIYMNFAAIKALNTTDLKKIDPATTEMTFDELNTFGERLKEVRAEVIKN